MKNFKNKAGIFIAVFSFALYAQSISFNYTVDDYFVLTKNNLVKQGIEAIPVILTTDFMLGYAEHIVRVPEYRPLPLILFCIEWQFFPNNPHAFHLVNVLLYSLTCWLLFILLCKLFKNLNLIFPFCCALLFAAHPIHTEVVDSIKSVDEILCFLFATLSMLFFIKFAENKLALNFIFAAFSFFLSLLSKETGIAFLLIIPLLIYVFTSMQPRKILSIAITLAMVAGVFLFIRFKILESIPGNDAYTAISPYTNSLVAASDFLSQKATAFYILLQYIFLLVFPYNLSWDYSIAQIPIQQVLSPGALIGIICYLGMGIYAFIKIRGRSPIAFAILFYLLALVPVSNIFLLFHWTMAERFLFMPSFGFCMLLTLLLTKSGNKSPGLKPGDSMMNISLDTQPSVASLQPTGLELFIRKNKTPLLLTFIIASFYSIRTIARNPDWKDNITLYSHDVSVVPHSSRAHFNLGLELLFTLYPREKNKEKQKSILYNSIAEFTKAISIYQYLPDAHSNRGIAYLNMEDYKNAIINYETAISLSSSISPSYVYCDLGFAYMKTDQHDKALSILDSSLKYYPAYTDAYIKKSHTYLLTGKNMEAILLCDKLLKLDSNNTFGYLNKGCGYLNLKDYAKAIQYLKKGFEKDSTNADCLHFLGMTYQETGDSALAHQYYEKEREMKLRRDMPDQVKTTTSITKSP